MKNDFLCPKCNGYLNVGDYIIFSAKTKRGDLGLILLSPKIGDYTVHKHPFFNFKKGERVQFFCPICHADLVAIDVNENLAKIKMIDDKNKEHTILFSGIAGEKCTYKITDKNVEAFGKDASKYINFFNLINW